MKKRRIYNSICIFVLIICVISFNLSACSFPLNKAKRVSATVIKIEKYGHAVLDVTAAELIDNGYALGDTVCVRFNSYKSDMPFFDGYYSKPGEPLLHGMSPEKNIAICINYGDFSKETGIAIGDSVEITLTEKAGMLATQEICSLKYSNDRADYADDATFANFREVTVGRIGKGRLYRSASPVNNENGRAGYANRLIASVNVATVVNLADSAEDIEEYIKADGFGSEYYRTLYENGRVIVLDMTANFYSEAFASSVAEGLKFLAQNEPPYCVHCTEGKDRAGFTVMLLSALMGADLQEIIDDYMLSFYNYYGIEKENEPERYKTVLDINLIAMLCHITGAGSADELKRTDLESAATEYLLSAGMTEREILTLKEKLG